MFESVIIWSQPINKRIHVVSTFRQARSFFVYSDTDTTPISRYLLDMRSTTRTSTGGQYQKVNKESSYRSFVLFLDGNRINLEHLISRILGHSFVLESSFWTYWLILVGQLFYDTSTVGDSCGFGSPWRSIDKYRCLFLFSSRNSRESSKQSETDSCANAFPVQFFQCILVENKVIKYGHVLLSVRI